MITTLDLHERRVQDELIQLMRDELGYRYMGKMDIDCQVFDTMGRIQKSMVGKTVKMDNKNIDAPRLSESQRKKPPTTFHLPTAGKRCRKRMVTSKTK